MRKLLTVLIAVLFILTFVGCSEQADNPATPEETPPVTDLTPEPTDQAIPTPTNAEAGVMIGDILYSGIPISQLFAEQFVGMWRNGQDSIVEIGANGRVISTETGNAVFPLNPCYEEDPESEFPAWEWALHRTALGAYVIRCCATHLELWFFPAGAEMVRYGTNWSLVPSDTSRARLFVGTFSLTACCPDEELLLEVFYRTTE